MNIGKAGQRAKDIISHVGDFVRLGKPEVKAESIQKIIEDVLEMLRDRVDRNHIKLYKSIGCNDTYVTANKIEIEQVLFNLIGNSIESIQQADCEDRQIDIECDFTGREFLTLTVRDSGTGISNSVAETLFEPYVTTKSQGLGMGLSISRTIIEAHGGRLWHETPASGGACLRFRLPLAKCDDE